MYCEKVFNQLCENISIIIGVNYMKTKCILIATMVTIITLLTGCNSEKTTTYPSPNETESIEPLNDNVTSIQKGQQYTVLDAREIYSYSHWNVNLVLLDKNDIRHYFSYQPIGDRSDKYYALSCLMKGDVVTYVGENMFSLVSSDVNE